MSLEIVKVDSTHAKALGKICFEAFCDIQKKFGSPPDFPHLELAEHLIQMLISRPDYYGVMAILEGKPVGSNFLSLCDTVAGVGPISVDPNFQSMKIGRSLMETILYYASQNNIQQIRLLQDSFNLTSFSLYASLGFEMKEPVALLQPMKSEQSTDTVRLGTPLDLPEVDQLTQRYYQISRLNEISSAMTMGAPLLVKENRGKISGYLIPGFFGHAVAESEEAFLELILAVGNQLHPPLPPFFLPLKFTSLYKKLIQLGCRAIKMMNLMAIGPYEAPTGVWAPSILY